MFNMRFRRMCLLALVRINENETFPGIPATLNYIDLETAEKPSPPLIPYPSWEKNAAGVCGENIITVHR